MPSYLNLTFADDGTVLGERISGGAVVGVEASLDLLWIDWANEFDSAASLELWSLQDGYGTPGHTPEQGWDWSGIRDSTPAARRKMLTAARRHLPDVEVARRLSVSVSVLQQTLQRVYNL